VLNIKNNSIFQVCNNPSFGGLQPLAKHYRYKKGNILWSRGINVTLSLIKIIIKNDDIAENIDSFLGNNHIGSCFMKIINEFGCTKNTHVVFNHKKEIPLSWFLNALILSPRNCTLVKFENDPIMILDRGTALTDTIYYNTEIIIRRNGGLTLNNLSRGVTTKIDKIKFIDSVPDINVHKYIEKKSFDYEKINRFQVKGDIFKSYLEITDHFKMLFGIPKDFDNGITTTVDRCYLDSDKRKKTIPWKKYRKYVLVLLILQRELGTFRHINGIRLNNFSYIDEYCINDYFSKYKPCHSVIPKEINDAIILKMDEKKKTISSWEEDFDAKAKEVKKEPLNVVIEKSLFLSKHTKEVKTVKVKRMVKVPNPDYKPSITNKNEFLKSSGANIESVRYLRREYYNLDIAFLRDKTEKNLDRYLSSTKSLLETFYNDMLNPPQKTECENEEKLRILDSQFKHIQAIFEGRTVVIEKNSGESHIEKEVEVLEDFVTIVPELRTMDSYIEKKPVLEKVDEWVNVRNKYVAVNAIKQKYLPLKNRYDSLSFSLDLDSDKHYAKSIRKFGEEEGDLGFHPMNQTKYKNKKYCRLENLIESYQNLPHTNLFELISMEKGEFNKQFFCESGHRRTLEGAKLEKIKKFLKKEIDAMLDVEIKAAIEKANNEREKLLRLNNIVEQNLPFNRKFSKKQKWLTHIVQNPMVDDKLTYMRSLAAITNNATCPKLCLRELKGVKILTKNILNAKKRVRSHVFSLSKTIL